MPVVEKSGGVTIKARQRHCMDISRRKSERPYTSLPKFNKSPILTLGQWIKLYREGITSPGLHNMHHYCILVQTSWSEDFERCHGRMTYVMFKRSCWQKASDQQQPSIATSQLSAEFLSSDCGRTFDQQPRRRSQIFFLSH